MNKRKLKFGFTFIEILVAVTVIGLIISTGAVSYSIVQKKSRDSRRQKDLQQLSYAIESYKAFHVDFPGETGKLYCSCRDSYQPNGYPECELDWPPADIAAEFPQGIQDPINTSPHCYFYAKGSYELNAVLELDNAGENDGGDQVEVYEIGTASHLNLITVDVEYIPPSEEVYPPSEEPYPSGI